MLLCRYRRVFGELKDESYCSWICQRKIGWIWLAHYWCFNSVTWGPYRQLAVLVHRFFTIFFRFLPFLSAFSNWLVLPWPILCLLFHLSRVSYLHSVLLEWGSTLFRTSISVYGLSVHVNLPIPSFYSDQLSKSKSCSLIFWPQIVFALSYSFSLRRFHEDQRDLHW